MTYALGLPDALRRRGLTVEVVPGWETRSAGSFNPRGAVCHWTAGPRGATGRPSLSVVTYGRGLQYPPSDLRRLDGPLCNVYGTRDGVAVVVAAGRANHAGAGSWKGVVGNSGAFGTEMEAADATDFTAEQRWAYPRINAAYCDLGGFGADMVCGHSEWAGPRKTDINGYTMDDLRRETAAILAGEEDDMFSDTDRQNLENLTRMMDAFKGGQEAGLYKPFFLATTVQGVAEVLRSEGVSGAGDPGRLAEVLSARLAERPGSPEGALTREDITAAVREVFGDAAAA